MVSIDNVMIDTYADVDISVDDIYEALTDEEKKEMFNLMLWNDTLIIKEIKDWLEEGAESIGYMEVVK